MNKTNFISESAEKLGVSLSDLAIWTPSDFSKWWRTNKAKCHPDNFVNETDDIQKQKVEEFAELSHAKSNIEAYLNKKYAKRSSGSKRLMIAEAIAEISEANEKKRKIEKIKEFGYVYLNMSLEQFTLHLKKSINVAIPVKIDFLSACSTCNGTAYMNGKRCKCHFCNGHGFIFTHLSDNESSELACPICRGKKEVATKFEDFCTQCNGTAIQRKSYVQEVFLRPDICDREVIQEAELREGAENVYKKIFIVLHISSKKG